jgi:hypothetical protein
MILITPLSDPWTLLWTFRVSLFDILFSCAYLSTCTASIICSVFYAPAHCYSCTHDTKPLRFTIAQILSHYSRTKSHSTHQPSLLPSSIAANSPPILRHYTRILVHPLCFPSGSLHHSRPTQIYVVRPINFPSTPMSHLLAKHFPDTHVLRRVASV